MFGQKMIFFLVYVKKCGVFFGFFF